MTVASRKIFWWYLLAAGVGGTALFVYFAVAESLGEPKFYAWPAVSLLLAIYAGVRLRRCYRQEPLAPGFWHMSIADMLLAAMITGIVMTIFQTGRAHSFLAVSAPLSLIVGLHYLAGVLAATHLVIVKFSRRHMYSFAFVLRGFGALGVASCASFLSF